MSRTDRRCDPRFPTAGVLLDNSALVRLWKCDALDVLTRTVHLHVAGHVASEFRAQGPSERAALARLGAEVHPVSPGTRAWDLFSKIRGDRHSTRDLGEEESYPVALAMAEKGELLPFITYDRPAASRAVGLES